MNKLTIEEHCTAQAATIEQLKAELNTAREACTSAQKEFEDLRVWLTGEKRYPVSGPSKVIAEKHLAELEALRTISSVGVKALEEISAGITIDTFAAATCTAKSALARIQAELHAP